MNDYYQNSKLLKRSLSDALDMFEVIIAHCGEDQLLAGERIFAMELKSAIRCFERGDEVNPGDLILLVERTAQLLNSRGLALTASEVLYAAKLVPCLVASGHAAPAG